MKMGGYLEKFSYLNENEKRSGCTCALKWNTNHCKIKILFYFTFSLIYFYKLVFFLFGCGFKNKSKLITAVLYRFLDIGASLLNNNNYNNK